MAFGLLTTTISTSFKFLNEKGVTPIDFSLCRNVVFCVVSCLVAVTQGHSITKPTNVKLLIARGISGTAVFLFFYLSVSNLPISLHTIIFQTSPFWTTILGFVILKEKVRVYEIVAMILCLVGVVAIALSKTASTGSDKNEDSYKIIAGVTFALMLAWSFSASSILNRALSSVPKSVLIFYASIIGTITTLVILFVQG